ncbi:hypothetical protein CK503_11150 [Aliifodinibius salipaludis]|uniref:RNA-directed DNA polymerase n=1 Tax=Fodinibius salipaludis TaxID=2032627 RepID=A0A2A2G961_9BACT|nr:reverse transcriptase domain-containing protein [Aliifodinibius salipaludis]PAU93700.1 hypothetical protein CK503_11150 [Aliifodinibius salipaludis]
MDVELNYSNRELKQKFANLKSLREVSDLLEISSDKLKYYLYILDDEKKYNEFKIPKRSGGTRSISAPNDSLKILQQKLNHILRLFYNPRVCVYGFVNDRDIVEGASKHTDKKYVLNVDIKDFFPSINFGRVWGLFQAKPFNLPEEAATVLAQICIFKNSLPQGAPTSPVISNFICAKLDSELTRLAKKHKVTYTRYADDLTFSTTIPVFPKSLAKINDAGQTIVGSELEEIINDNGFEVNHDKVKLMNSSQRQEVTGITVNEFTNVNRSYVRKIRAMLHAWEKFGYENAEDTFHREYCNPGINPERSKPPLDKVIKGKLEHLGKVKGKHDPVFLKYYHKLVKLDDKYEREHYNKKYQLLDHNEYPFILDRLNDRFQDIKKLKPHPRGYAFEDFLNELFKTYSLEPRKPFKNVGEQIDGSLNFEGNAYLIEAKWQDKNIEAKHLNNFQVKVDSKASWARGIFISISPFTDGCLKNFREGKSTKLLGILGDEIESMLKHKIDLREVLKYKARKSVETGDFFTRIENELK